MENKSQRAQLVAINDLTEEVLCQYAEAIESNNIRVEKDLPELAADVYPRFIHSAVAQLIENAIGSMPNGGDLNVTLIEGDSCWELEIADSVNENRTVKQTTKETTPALPKIDALANRCKLEIARRAAVVHGGQIQTWDCPQGGTANVLVIPRRQESHKSA